MRDYLKIKFDPDKMVDVLDEVPLWSAPFGLKLLDFVNYKRNIHALDIGFGTGFPLTELAMRLGDGSTVYGIDPWKNAISRTKKKRIRYMINNVVIIEGEAESIPLENGFIDLIVSNNGINNVKDSDTVLSECSRVIKPCGQFIFTMNLENSMFEFYNLFESVLSEMNLRQEKVRMQHHISYSRPPLDNILSQLQKHGFEIIDLEHDQFDYKFADGTAMFRHYFIRWHS